MLPNSSLVHFKQGEVLFRQGDSSRELYLIHSGTVQVFIVKNGKINWARAWTDREIVAGRARDRADLRNYYSDVSPEAPAAAHSPSREQASWGRRQLSKVAALVRRR